MNGTPETHAIFASCSYLCDRSEAFVSVVAAAFVSCALESIATLEYSELKFLSG